jgi:transketolase
MGRAQQAGHARGARRTIRRRRNQAYQAQLRLAGRCEIPCAGRSARAFSAGHRRARQKLRDEWFAKLGDYGKANPELADHLTKMQKRELPDGWDKDIPTFEPDAKGVAGRDSSAKILNAIAKNVPWLIGGAADLAPSTKRV